METNTPKSFITVVSGLPRSGTSLMMQMLKAGGHEILTDGKRAADEDNPLGYYEYEAVKHSRTATRWLAVAENKAVKTIHLLLKELPSDYDYRVIFMRRNLREVIASQRAMLERQGKKGAAIPDAKLAEVFEHQLAQIEQWLADRANFRVLWVDHRQLIENPQEIAGQVNDFLGGCLKTSAMAAEVDASLYRQRDEC